MGTRNLFTIILNGQKKLAKYNQWDGYLDGQGQYLSDFIVNDLDFEKLKDGLVSVRFVKETEFDEKLATIGITENSISFEQGDLITETFPLLSRDVCIDKTLNSIQNLQFKIKSSTCKDSNLIRNTKEVTVLRENLITSDQSEFLNDGLFCEYAYELNLDLNTVRVFENRKTAKDEWKCDRLVIDCDILQFPEVLDAKLAEIKAQNKE